MKNKLSSDSLVSKSLLGTYCQFLRSPVLTASSEVISWGKTRNHILRLYSLHLLLILIVGLIIQSLDVSDSNILPDVFADTPPWFFFIAVVIVIPLIEEIIFRLPLRAFTVNLSLSISLVLAYSFVLMASLSRSSLAVLISMLVGLNLYFWITRLRIILLQRLYNKFPRIIFYFFTLLFGIIHITNYDSKVWSWLPLLVLPQILLSLFFGFVRLRYGFGWAVFAHSFHNGCLLLPIWLLKVLGSDRFQVQKLAEVDTNTLPLSDLLLIAGVSFYAIGGLFLCLIVAWKILREWTQSH